MAVTANENLIYREEKGPMGQGNEAYNLTPQEVDGNFKLIDNRLVNLEEPADTGTQLLFKFPAGSLNEITTLISAGEAGTYQSITEGNTTTQIIEVNGTLAPLPITLATNETLKVTITRTNTANAAYVRLNTIAI